MRFGRRRLVRLHLEDPAPSIEGVLVGVVAGHYRLLKPELLEATDRTSQLDGELWVLKSRVVFVQVIG